MIRDVKWKKNFVVLAILALAITFYMPTSEAQEDPYIEEVLYSKGSENSATVVLSGRDNATFYKYIILDDITEAPENWFEPNFNDTSWEFGAAPFGDREYDDIDPNTDWDTDGNSPYEDDIILVRHKFKMSGIVTSAQIDVAFANYCTPYLNGNIIYEERGANNHVQNYWNEDGTEEISPSSFLQGQNVLAVYGRDYVAGWQNRQWLDLEINANIFEPSNETIIFGDTVTVAVKGGNKGDVSAEEVIIESVSYTHLTLPTKA